MHDESSVEIDELGNKFWKNKEGNLNRIGGPAEEYICGSKFWYKNGLLHRLDGPAIECANGTKHWYKDGKMHRIDGPAIEWASGDKQWYKNGKRFKSKDTFFRALGEKEKEAALFSEDFLNA